MYKVKSQISPLPVQEMFKVHDNVYDLRKKRCWETSNVRTVHYGTETVLFRGPKRWEMIPVYIKDSTNLNVFKTKRKQWKPLDCTCRLCRTYIHSVHTFIHTQCRIYRLLHIAFIFHLYLG